MSHKNPIELKELLQEAEILVQIGGKYFHYKNPDKFYTVLDLVLIEATEEVGVVYRADYEELKGIKFVRPVNEFCAKIEIEGKMVSRFNIVKYKPL
jgi:hypothetical protein